jgi:transcription elongation GreA/GreB family factor
MALDRRVFIEQLQAHYQASLAQARRAEQDAREAARTMATESEKREDGRAAIEFGSLATGHTGRADTIVGELDALLRFSKVQLPRFDRRTPIAVGAVIDLATEDDEGASERTFVMFPVGGGMELTGPGGDGVFSVITPTSPIGKALLGLKVGDDVDVPSRGGVRSWTVVDVC